MSRKNEMALEQLAAEYLASETHAQNILDNPFLQIEAKTIQGCVCPCIKEAKVDEFACPYCVGYYCVLKGLCKAVAAELKTRGCRDPCCARWAHALTDSDALSELSCCERIELHGYTAEGVAQPLRLFPRRCVLSKAENGVSPCTACGIDKIIPSCLCMGAEALLKPASWLKRQPTVEGKNQDVVKDRFRMYTGTVDEALKTVVGMHRPTELHKWDDKFTRRQFQLDAATFDGDTEAVIYADASSAMKLGAGYRVVCESDST